ncbi:hypothetical protein DFR30_2869 [Thiogranum longum]|uniref:Spermatogenesis-associated protein 20-like TRX domain-containing protein n=1 Tax=Thiogranum longum TaxID=1537524 RepID=A0A4R1HGL1_9GAMM|nr:DUF255 domain-containing protein [Thiogranum longum]TCK19555.1 hypothetical protein DFR30_2869 [Thiogranum longum]
MKKLFLCLLLVIFSGSLMAAAGPHFDNRLKDHPSPYLAMHGEDPVHWQSWGEEAVQLAKKLNRPLFISSGYFSCHWCHVMQRESYRDPEVAKILNTWFIPVKVDRELNPALDSHLIEFVQLTRGRAGWPLNVFLTPEGYPVVGITYLPKDRFLALLTQLRDRWQSDPDELRRLAQDALDEWRSMRQPADVPVSPEVPVAPKFVEQAGKLMDELSGGFGEQNKFPMTPQMRALLKVRVQVKGRKNLDEFLRLTLDNMAGQGMHDLIGGGFFRYVVDPGWQTPHYEKMLYDNAQLASLYLQAATAFSEPRYRATAFETLDFMLREMWRDNHFISSFSAVDAQGREGAYYLWDEETLRKILTDKELTLVKTAWFDAVAAQSEWGKLPRWQLTMDEIAHRTGQPEGAIKHRLEVIREKMLKARAARSLPADNKGLAAWNGLALSALADAVGAGGSEAYRETGDQLASYLATKLWDGKRLGRALDAGKVLADGTVQDYAMVAKGLQDWVSVSGDEQYAEIASELVKIAWKRFYRKNRWLESDMPLIPMLDGKLALDDNPLPSATALVAGLSLDMEGLQNNKPVQKLVTTHLDQVRSRLSDSIFWYASYVEWLDRN